MKFENFYADMKNGYTDSMTIDRIDSSKNYCKENCRWISKSENSRNTSRVYIYEGKSASQASILLGGCEDLVTQRMRIGWDLKKSFTTPKKQKK